MQFYFEVHFSEILNENLAQMFESLLCVCVSVCFFCGGAVVAKVFFQFYHFSQFQNRF